ncbi:hypothetical protein ACO0LC_09705 [Undibacterium sp. JH2W]|uniref:hypothetical protein n=1 Tax=Undibacterium sp. JH2W TaxID=3413037 RepID=UPI003BF39F2D
MFLFINSFRSLLKYNDLVLARLPHVGNNESILELGTVYRTKYLFRHRYFSFGHEQLEVQGCGKAGWRELPSYSGELGLFFLHRTGHDTVRANYHIPVEVHEDGVWCLIHQTPVWKYRDVPILLKYKSKPDFSRLDKDGQPIHFWVKFSALEAYLKNMIVDIDKKSYEEFDIQPVKSWLGAEV